MEGIHNFSKLGQYHELGVGLDAATTGVAGIGQSVVGAVD